MLILLELIERLAFDINFKLIVESIGEMVVVDPALVITFEKFLVSPTGPFETKREVDLAKRDYGPKRMCNMADAFLEIGKIHEGKTKTPKVRYLSFVAPVIYFKIVTRLLKD